MVIIFSRRKPKIMPKLVFDNKLLENVTEFNYLRGFHNWRTTRSD